MTNRLTLLRKVRYTIYVMNTSQRSPRTNALIIAGVILLSGFMAYNFIGRQMTQLAGKSYRPPVVTPTQILSPTPSSLTPTPMVTNAQMQTVTPTVIR